ncbi:MAG: hypothetical protein EXR49_02615 [Dehalococcoidia bacterium]|nr:hypothetical protein [Dehalococcoidia bacterium]
MPRRSRTAPLPQDAGEITRQATHLWGAARAGTLRSTIAEHAAHLARVSRDLPPLEEMPAWPAQRKDETRTPTAKTPPRVNARSKQPVLAHLPNLLTIAQAARAIAQGSLSPVVLAQACLHQIDLLEPSLHAWVTIDRDAVLASAQALQHELEKTGPRSPLHGIPIGIKDIFCTAGMRTTACSRILAGFVPQEDAGSISKLKAAGAIVLGKTVTTEFAAGDPSPARNPWNDAHTPGGSSSGSAVAVAARMCPAAMGSQTGGSILRPAAYNGVVGLKPTFGRIGISGVFPVAWSFDTIGPITTCVEDAALLLQALAGHDPRDPGASNAPVPDYRLQMRRYDAAPRIGVIRDFLTEANSGVARHTRQICQRLSRAGAVVEEVSAPPSYALAQDLHWVILCAELAAYHQQYHRRQAGLYSEQLRRRMEAGFLTPASSYLQAQRHRSVLKREIEALASEWDVLLTPSTPSAAPGDLTTTGSAAFQNPWSSTGLPSMTLPSGLTKAGGLPLGIQLVSSPFTEGRLLGAARWCERVLDFQSIPAIAQNC